MSRRNQSKELAYPHYALICLDQYGNLHRQASRSIRDNCEVIISSEVTNTFLRAVARSTIPGPSSPQTIAGTTTSSTPQSPSYGHIPLQPLLHHAAEVPKTLDHRGYYHGPTGIRTPTYPNIWPLQQPQQDLRPRQQWSSVRSSQEGLISIKDKDFLRRYYQKVFQNLQQTNCKLLAKVYVKLVEPRKQIHYPYNGRKSVAGSIHQFHPDETKPPWWPSGVSHREPDHLRKAERIRLLIHILCGLRMSHGVTARKLKEADQPIRLRISPAERLQLLDEVYQVREEEEKFEEGLTDGKVMVSIAEANRPGVLRAALSQEPRGRRISLTGDAPTQGQKENKEVMVPFSGPNQRTMAAGSDFTPGHIPSGQSATSLPPPCNSHSDVNLQTLPTQRINCDSISSSTSQLDNKRKFAHLRPTATATSHTLGYYQPRFLNHQSFIEESYGEIYGFSPQVVQTASHIAEDYEQLDSFAYPYYPDTTNRTCL